MFMKVHRDTHMRPQEDLVKFAQMRAEGKANELVQKIRNKQMDKLL
jgi:hypothetical protein